MLRGALWWVCAVAGLFVMPLWVVNVLYFVMDPQPAYREALERVEIQRAGPGAVVPPVQ